MIIETRDEEMTRRRAVRTTSIVNGWVLASTGLLTIGAMVGIWINLALKRENLDELTSPAFLAIACIGLACFIGGVLMIRYGKVISKDPNPALPTRADLPPDHPRNLRSVVQRQLISGGLALAWLALSCLSVWLSFQLSDANDWVRFALFFGVPPAGAIALQYVLMRYTGSASAPRP